MEKEEEMLLERKLEAQKRQGDTGFLSADSIVIAQHMCRILWTSFFKKTHANEPMMAENKH